MGNYANSTDLTDRLGVTTAARLTTDSGATPDAGKLNAALSAAEGVVDSYLARRAATPIDVAAFPQAADLLKNLVLDLAVPRVHRLRAVVSPNLAEQAKVAMEWLTKFAKGEANLPTAATVPSSDADDPPASFGYETRLGGRDNFEGL